MQHWDSPWLWAISAIVISCIISGNFEPFINATRGAFGLGLLWLFTWALHGHRSFILTRNIVADWWLEIASIYGILMTFLPAAGYIGRAVIATPIAWVLMLISKLILDLIDDVLLGQLLNYFFPTAANIQTIYGNIINVITFIFIAQHIAGRLKFIVGLTTSVFAIAMELMIMNSRYHECSIIPLFFPNPELTWWQWTNFGLSIVAIIVILYFTILDIREERGSGIGNLLWA